MDNNKRFRSEEVIKKWDSIDDGIGLPDWKLSLCLLLAWILICAILMKGVNKLLHNLSNCLFFNLFISLGSTGSVVGKSGLFYGSFPLRRADYAFGSRSDFGRRFGRNSLLHPPWLAQAARCQR